MRIMLGRLRRTARFIATTTYAHRDFALQAIAKVKAIHAQVSGTLPDGDAYRATDPRLLAWVHVAGAINFLDGWRRYAEPGMSNADQDRYFAESGDIAAARRRPRAAQSRRSGAVHRAISVPSCRPTSARARFATWCWTRPPRSLAEVPVQALLMNAAVDLMPEFAREMHGLSRPLLSPLVRGGTLRNCEHHSLGLRRRALPKE